MTSLRKFGIVLAVLLVGSVVFSGGALASDNDVSDIDQTNVQVAQQNANIDQDQSSTSFNAAFINNDDQTAVTESNQEASIDQDIDQDQDADIISVIDF